MNIRTCKLISLNAKYHLHVQHSTNAQNIYASRNKILPGTRMMYLKKMQNIKKQVLCYKAKVQNPKYIEIEYKFINIKP